MKRAMQAAASVTAVGRVDEIEIRNIRRCSRPPWVGRNVYIGRGGKWGNPFVLGRDGNREEVIAKYRAWIVAQPELMAALPELRGKLLYCYCAPLACHGDVLKELAS